MAMREPSLSVLVVEDDDKIKDIVSSVLEEAGFRVTTAHSGWEALAIFERETFDLLVADILLTKGLTGLELAKCARLRHPALKCLFISGCHEPVTDEPEQDDFVAKPFFKHELLGCAWELLQRQGAATASLGWDTRQAERALIAAEVACRRRQSRC
jgi:DNA-binding response OmpR family regulator